MAVLSFLLARLTIGRILMLALLLRMVLFAYALTAPSIVHDGDSDEFLALAESLVERGEFEADSNLIFPTGSVRTPGYPIFIAFWLAIAEYWLVPLLLVQTLLSTANVWLTYRIASGYGCPESLARLAAFLLAFDPTTVIYAVTIMSETVFTTGLLLVFWLLLRLCAQPAIWQALLLALALAAIIMIRPVAQFYPLLLLLLIGLMARANGTRRWLLAGVQLMLVGVLLSGWLWRNQQRYDFAGMSTIQPFDVLYYGGALPLARDAGISWDAAEDSLTAVLHQRIHPDTVTTGAYAREMQKLGFAVMLDHLPTYIRLHAQGMAATLLDPGRINLARMVYGRQQGGTGLLEVTATRGVWQGLLWLVREQPELVLLFSLSLLWQGLFIAAALLGLLPGWRRLPGLLFWSLLLTIAYYVFMPGIFGAARFRVPVVPMMAIFAALGITWALGWRRRLATSGEEVAGLER